MVLGGVDKFEPVSGGGMYLAEEALRELVIAGGDGAVDFEACEEALDVVALFVAHPAARSACCRPCNPPLRRLIR